MLNEHKESPRRSSEMNHEEANYRASSHVTESAFCERYERTDKTNEAMRTTNDSHQQMNKTNTTHRAKQDVLSSAQQTPHSQDQAPISLVNQKLSSPHNNTKEKPREQ